jgi:hypothetical protein
MRYLSEKKYKRRCRKPKSGGKNKQKTIVMKTIGKNDVSNIEVMEPRDHFKNGASLKSQMSKTNFLMKNLNVFLVLTAFAILFNACERDDFPINPLNNSAQNAESKAKDGGSTIVWNGAPDRAVAVNIDFVTSPRTNASGIKIPSNAHSADFPGLYFIWDSKQKDNGYLKVASSVFEQYGSFVLTSKESNKYFDFLIAQQPGQQMTADDCYVFFIPKVYNNKNINMVFLPEFTNNDNPPVDPHGNYLVALFSGDGMPNENVFYFGNTVTSIHENGAPYQDLWNGGIQRDNHFFGGLIGYPEWAWTMPNSLETGTEGSTVTFEKMVFVKGKQITEASLLFAADNAIAVWINGVRIGKTRATGFNDGKMTVLDGSHNGWGEVVEINEAMLLNALRLGSNTVKIVARNAAHPSLGLDPNNADGNRETYSTINNPAGILFSLIISSND